MRLIGQLPAEADARRFVDYLLTRRIAAHAEEADSGAWQLWVEHDDHIDPALAEFRQFQDQPNDPRYGAAATVAETLRREEQKAAERRQQNYRDVRTTMFAAPSGGTPATFVIIGIAVALFVITHFSNPTGRRSENDRTVSFGTRVESKLLFDDLRRQADEATAGNTRNSVFEGSRLAIFNSVLRGEVWRLVTPAFLHGSILHILFNMMWMIDLGRRIEPIKGTAKFLALFAATAALSCLAEALWVSVSPFNKEHYAVFLGMSGVVSGLFGYAWACGRYRPYEKIGVSQHETGYMLGWLAICTFGFVGPIANAAHWGGLVVGYVIGAWPTWWRKMKA